MKHRPIVCGLASQLCEVDAGAKLGCIEVELNRLISTFMRIQRIVASVVGEIGRNGREPNVLILGQHQLGTKLLLSNVQVLQGAETLVGQGASQPDGHIVLELASGRKQVRLTGMLLPVHPEPAPAGSGIERRDTMVVAAFFHE